MLGKLRKIPAVIARDGVHYTLRRLVAWCLARLPLTQRLSFLWWREVRLTFAPSMLTYRMFADRANTRIGDIRALERHVTRGSTVIDVGANAGTFTLVAAALAGTTGRVLSFEPSPKFAAIIKRNVACNAFTTVTVHQVALGATGGTVYLNEAVADDTTNYVSATGTPVPQATLDSFTSQYTDIDVLKIDAEGSELAVLRGATHTLRKTRVLIFEICNKTLARNNVDVQELYNLLTQSFNLYHKNTEAPFVFDPKETYNTDLIGYHI